MLPNMSNTVLNFAQVITKRVVTQQVINHRTVKTYDDIPFKATITTPQPEDLQQVEINTALKYKLSHSIKDINIDDIFIHRGVEYKVIQLSKRDDYGYYRALGEEIQ